LANNNNEVNITFKAFTQNFNSSIREMDDQTKRLRQEMKLQQEQMKHTASTTDQLEAKINSLQQIYDVQSRKTQEAARALEQAKQLWGESSQEVAKLEDQLRRHRIAEQQAANAITETQQALERAQQAQASQQQAMRQLNNLFQATGRSLSDFSDVLGQDLTQAIRRGTATSAQLERAFNQISRSALGTNTDLQQLRQVLRQLDNGSSIAEVRQEMERLRTEIVQTSDASESLGSGLKALAGALPAAAVAGIAESTHEDAIQMAMLENQVKNATKAVESYATTTKKMSASEVKDFESKLSKQEDLLAKSLDNQESAVQKSYEQQRKLLDKSLDNEYEAVSKKYEKQEAARQKSLDKQYEYAVDTYEKQLDELNDSLEDELKAFEKASDAKIALIDKEYKERLKLIDEDKYRQIKAIDDEIKAMEDLMDSDDKATKQAENAKKRYDLQTDVAAARNKEQREAAEQALATFEAELRAEQLKEERKAQIENLKNEKDAINDAASLKKDALEEEFDERKQKAKDSIEAEKEVIQERQKAERESFIKINQDKLELLKENQQAELESLRTVNESRLKALQEEQEQRKELLDERLDNEMKAIQESHQAELDSFKEMNKKKIELASSPVTTPKQTVKVNAELEMGDIKQARVNFASVRQDVGQVTEAMGNLLAAGYSTKEQITDISEALSGAISKYGETFTAEGLAESINTTTKLGESTGQFTDLLEKEKINVTDFNSKLQEMGSVAERANYISQLLANQGLNGLFKEYTQLHPELYDAAQAQVENRDAMIELGNALRPLVTEVTKLITKVVELVNQHPKITAAIAAIISVVGILMGAFAALAPVIYSITSIFGGGGGLLGIFSKVGPFLANLATKILPLLGRAFGFLTGPIGIVISILTIAVPLIIKNWDSISGFFKNLWEKIVGIFKGAIDGISGFFQKWGPTVLNILKLGPIGLLVNFFKNNWDSIWSVTQTIFGRVKDAIVSPIEKARDAVKNAIDKIKSFFNFKFEWPELKVPHIKVKKGSLNPLKWFSEGFPEIEVEFYKNGGIMTRPTLFGGNGNTAFVGGEAGAEAILPLNERVLASIGNAIYAATNREGNSQQTDYNREITVNVPLEIDGRTIAKATAKYYDRELYSRYLTDKRGQ